MTSRQCWWWVGQNVVGDNETIAFSDYRFTKPPSTWSCPPIIFFQIHKKGKNTWNTNTHTKTTKHTKCATFCLQKLHHQNAKRHWTIWNNMKPMKCNYKMKVGSQKMRRNDLFTTGTMKSKNVEENRRRATFLTTVGICQIGTLFSSID